MCKVVLLQALSQYYLCIEPSCPFKRYRGGQVCCCCSEDGRPALRRHLQIRTSRKTVPATAHISCSELSCMPNCSHNASFTYSRSGRCCLAAILVGSVQISEACLTKPRKGSGDNGEHNCAEDRCSSPLSADAARGSTGEAAQSRKPLITHCQHSCRDRIKGAYNLAGVDPSSGAGAGG